MKLSSIFSVGLALLGLIAFQVDQVSHAARSPKAPQHNLEGAHVNDAHHSFASPRLGQSNFQKHGHPCNDLGHSEEDCPVANIVDGLDIISVNHFLGSAFASRHVLVNQSLAPKDDSLYRQIRGPPFSLV